MRCFALAAKLVVEASGIIYAVSFNIVFFYAP